MKTILISEFKAKCIGILKTVRETGEPVTVTLRGEPLAKIEPAGAPKSRRLGAQKESTRSKGDLVAPCLEGEWEMES